jgi:hypothetical protein
VRLTHRAAHQFKGEMQGTSLLGQYYLVGSEVLAVVTEEYVLISFGM